MSYPPRTNFNKDAPMRIATVWEAQMQFWGNNEGGSETKLCHGRGYMWYLFQERADDVSMGGPAIERKVLERDGLYFMTVRPYYGEIKELPTLPLDEDSIMNIQVFMEDIPCGGEISSLWWDSEMERRGRPSRT